MEQIELQNFQIELKNFHIDRLLLKSKERILILCQHNETNQPAILFLMHTYREVEFSHICGVFNNTVLKVLSQNDVNYKATVNLFEQDFNCLFVWPACQGYVRYYARHPVKYEETARDYFKFTQKYIHKAPSCQWIYNILDGNAQDDQVVIRDEDPQNGFVLLRNDFLKKSTAGRMTYCAFVNRRNLKSIRDLTDSDIPLLYGLLTNCLDAICQETGLNQSQLVAFAHYHPSFFHLHFHFKRRNDAGNPEYSIEKIIERLKQTPDFYKRATLKALCHFPSLLKTTQVSRVIDAVEQIKRDNISKVIDAVEVIRRENMNKKQNFVARRLKRNHLIHAWTGRRTKTRRKIKRKNKSRPVEKKPNEFDLHGPPQERVLSATPSRKECILMKSSIAMTLKFFYSQNDGKENESVEEETEEQREDDDNFLFRIYV